MSNGPPRSFIASFLHSNWVLIEAVLSARSFFPLHPLHFLCFSACNLMARCQEGEGTGTGTGTGFSRNSSFKWPNWFPFQNFQIQRSWIWQDAVAVLCLVHSPSSNTAQANTVLIWNFISFQRLSNNLLLSLLCSARLCSAVADMSSHCDETEVRPGVAQWDGVGDLLDKNNKERNNAFFIERFLKKGIEIFKNNLLLVSLLLSSSISLDTITLSLVSLVS